MALPEWKQVFEPCSEFCRRHIGLAMVTLAECKAAARQHRSQNVLQMRKPGRSDAPIVLERLRNERHSDNNGFIRPG
ncbi:hypothetical protein J2T09_000183 [Neorhizobium huautlense]|uniref:Uncharacterized protein n=1 Tax=Neorhizobium huautlense TaxID=67774 RepID=A0ABT9PLV7_9HYPH|nr:hypothetical protein [Neorhizobium huautlense]MDP9835442.1 hypothetical protein [Neorhizobium huautlense]